MDNKPRLRNHSKQHGKFLGVPNSMQWASANHNDAPLCEISRLLQNQLEIIGHKKKQENRRSELEVSCPKDIIFIRHGNRVTSTRHFLTWASQSPSITFSYMARARQFCAASLQSPFYLARALHKYLRASSKLPPWESKAVPSEVHLTNRSGGRRGEGLPYVQVWLRY